MKPLSICEIAKQGGVSPATVSRVVNEKQCVNTKTRAHIRKIIEETGYVPNKAARAMVLRRSFTVGMVIPCGYTLFQYRIFSLVERYLHKLGYRSLRLFLEPLPNSARECLSILKSENPDGIILFCGSALSGFSEYLAASTIPVVSDTGGLNTIPAVTIDNRKAAYEAVSHLIRLGHRKIGMIRGSDNLGVSQRFEGYCQALAENNITYDQSLVVYEGHSTFDNGKNGMGELLLRTRDFSAVFAASDELAIGAIRVLQDEGIRVPGDVSIVGFDDVDIASYVIPRLTTIHQPLDSIGQQTALILHNRISGNSDTVEPVIPHKLVVRESTAVCNR